MPAANFGTGSLALQIAQGNKACLRSSGSGEVSIKSSSGQKEVPASPEISRGSHAGHSGQNAEGRQTRSKTSQRGSVSPMTTPKSGLSILPLSDASASLNSASLEPQNLARSPSPVSQPIQIPSPDPQCILGLSIEPSGAEEKRDAPHAEGEGPAQQNPLAASTYLTRIPDCLFPSLLEEREPTEQMTQAGNDTEKDLEPLLWTEPDLLTASTDKVLPDIDTESLAAADVQVQEVRCLSLMLYWRFPPMYFLCPLPPHKVRNSGQSFKSWKCIILSWLGVFSANMNFALLCWNWLVRIMQWLDIFKDLLVSLYRPTLVSWISAN